MDLMAWWWAGGQDGYGGDANGNYVGGEGGSCLKCSEIGHVATDLPTWIFRWLEMSMLLRVLK